MSYRLTRRSVMKSALAFAACSAMPSFARAALPSASRSLNFHNTHTGESLEATYWENGVYDSGALEEINRVLRDHRTNEVKAIDPHLLDILTALHRTMDSSKPFEVISGYRSPHSNEILHERSRAVAVHSYHIQGRAIDIRLTDRSLTQLRDAALAMQQGGVGYYPDSGSNFVHVDTGRIRRW